MYDPKIAIMSPLPFSLTNLHGYRIYIRTKIVDIKAVSRELGGDKNKSLNSPIYKFVSCLYFNSNNPRAFVRANVFIYRWKQTFTPLVTLGERWKDKRMNGEKSAERQPCCSFNARCFSERYCVLTRSGNKFSTMPIKLITCGLVLRASLRNVSTKQIQIQYLHRR